MAFQVKINYLRGGTSAPQNLQGTVCPLLLAGTTWSRIHLGHVRLRCKIVLITAKKGFISLPLSFGLWNNPLTRAVFSGSPSTKRSSSLIALQPQTSR